MEELRAVPSPRSGSPFSLLSYRDAAKRADFIVEVTADNRMPPWKPHPGAGVFLDARRLSALEKEILRDWAATGCAAGDPADLPRDAGLSRRMAARSARRGPDHARAISMSGRRP